jgi:hypothetical protein
MAFDMDRELEAVALRLHRLFPEISDFVVETTVVGVADSLRGARVRAYIPILVEHEARDLLAARAVS